MNTNELIDSFAKTHGLGKEIAKRDVTTILDAIASALASGEDVELRGIGKFRIKQSAERQGRNPQTGDTMTIKASRRLSFSISKPLKDALNA